MTKTLALIPALAAAAAIGLAACGGGSGGHNAPPAQIQQPQGTVQPCWYLDQSGYVAVESQNNRHACKTQVAIGGVSFTKVTGQPTNMSSAQVACTQPFNDGSSVTVFTTLPGFWEDNAVCGSL
jgi:hypothetical protein